MPSVPSPIQRLVGAYKQLGWKQFHRQLLAMCEPKPGRLVGTDYSGNRYYENNREQQGRNRWVDYAQYDFNGSQVPPEWHAWLNHVRLDPPHLDPIVQRSEQAWKAGHHENLTGTRAAFKTYSTTAPKVFAWQPKVAERH
ncbi:NDUFA12-domain-containing protein [Cystobasidium minutum MCA 4210]|uniref:NDUFA12-domain-containing protein n=1 Tax=Cystobasidium minutum MCA 4210 TaxID=1397322 RepID=UPI0034CE1B4E|eukprot:jgi/Rhomi1/183686/fgenesh1_pm.4_\